MKIMKILIYLFSIFNFFSSFFFVILLLDQQSFLICSNYKYINDNVYLIIFIILLLQIILLFTKLKYVSLIFSVIGNYFGIKILYLVFYPLKEYVNLNKFIQIKRIIPKEDLSLFLDTLIKSNDKINLTSEIREDLVKKSVNRVDLENMFNELVKYYSNLHSKKYTFFDYLSSISSSIYENRTIILVISGVLFTFGVYFYINNYFNNNNIIHIRDSVQDLIRHETREQQYINHLSNDVRTIVDSIDDLDNEVQDCKGILSVLKSNYLELAQKVKILIVNQEKLESNDNLLLQKINTILNNEELNGFSGHFTIDMIKFLSLYTKDLMEDFSSNVPSVPNAEQHTQQSLSPTFIGSHRLGSSGEFNNNNNNNN